MDHPALDRAWPDDGDLGDQVFEPFGMRSRQTLLLSATFDLIGTDRIGSLQQTINGRIIER
jgi:hypothetical protein